MGNKKKKSLENKINVSIVVRGITGPKKDEVTGGWRKLHNEELRDLCSSSSIIRMMR
jgi:hypothetical protein